MLQKLIGQLVELRQSFKKEKQFKLKELSAELIKQAALTNDYFKALMSLIAYSLYKLSSKTHVRKNPKWKLARTEILSHLDAAIGLLEKHDFRNAEEELRDAVEHISKADSEISNYAKGIFEKSKTKMASSAYSFGLSLGQAAWLTGADKKDLMNYIGVTKMHEEAGISLGISERLKNLKGALSA